MTDSPPHWKFWANPSVPITCGSSINGSARLPEFSFPSLRRTVPILERELPFCQIEEYSGVGRFDEVENLGRLP